MKINKLEIAHFGKFSDYSLDLKNGFQVLYGNNEDGKSTLMAFIEMMFYGDQGRSRAIDKNSRLKYLPWNGSPMEGAIEFEHSGTSYRLQKLFGATPSRDVVDLINLSTNSSVELEPGEEVGTYFLGIDLDSFRRSSFIGQVGRIEIRAGTDMVAEKLMSSVTETGDEGFSNQEIVNRLDEAMTNMQARRGNRGTLVEAKKDLEDLKNEREKVLHQIENQAEIVNQYRQLENLQTEKENIEKVLSLHSAEEKRKNLTSLLAKSKNFEYLEKSITTEKYNLKNIQPLIYNLSNSAEKQEQIIQGLKPLESSVSNEDISFITSDDFNYFQNLLKIHSQSRDILEFYRNIVLPAKTDAEEVSSNYEHTENTFNEQKLALEALEPSINLIEEANTKKLEIEKDLITIENRVSSRQALWNDQRVFEKNKLSYAKRRLDDVKAVIDSTSKVNPTFMVLGILILIASGAAGYLLNPLAYTGASLGVVFIILAFVKRISSSKKQALKDAETELQKASDAMAKFEKDIETEKQNFIKEIEFLRSEDDKLKTALSHLQSQKGQYLSLEESLKDINRSFQILALDRENKYKKLESIRDQLSDKLSQSDKNIKSLTENIHDLDYVAIKLSNIESETDKKLSELIEQKKASSIEDFQKKHLDYQSTEKTRFSIKKMQLKLETERDTFLNLIQSYKNVFDFNEAYNLYIDLNDKYTEISKLKNEIELTSSAMGIKDSSIPELERMLEELTTERTDLDDDDIELLKSNLKSLDEIGIVDRIKELAGQIRPPERSLEQIESEIDDLSEQVKEMQEYYDSLSTALEVMVESQEEMRRSFGPLLDKKTSEIFSELTGGKYDDVVINKDYEIKVKSGVHLREFPYLSSGTIDQAYLALRLAISSLIAEPNEAIPVFLDDVLVQYDDLRAAHAISFLSEYSDKNNIQIVLFSCHERMVTLAEKFEVSTKSVI